MKRAESIIEGGNIHECWICNEEFSATNARGLHLHHIFFGKNRSLSDKYGCWCYLCYDHHEGTFGIHGKFGHDRDMTLKRVAQRAWEQKYGSREEFRAIFGKSYLDDDLGAEIGSEEGQDGC